MKTYTTCQILKKIYNASDFDLKVLQRVRFWIEKNYNALDFEIKIFRLVSV